MSLRNLIKGAGMSKKAEVKEVAPEWKLAAAQQAERGALIGRLSDEAVMWRNFATGCEPDRHVHEHYGYMLSQSPTLRARMDRITAPMWKAFALQMADSTEARLKEIL